MPTEGDCHGGHWAKITGLLGKIIDEFQYLFPPATTLASRLCLPVTPTRPTPQYIDHLSLIVKVMLQ